MVVELILNVRGRMAYGMVTRIAFPRELAFRGRLGGVTLVKGYVFSADSLNYSLFLSGRLGLPDGIHAVSIDVLHVSGNLVSRDVDSLRGIVAHYFKDGGLRYRELNHMALVLAESKDPHVRSERSRRFISFMTRDEAC